MSLPDTFFIFALALVIFGPKKLPEIGRQIGKLVVEFRRASNEFKMQIEEELRSAEQADRQKQLAAQTVAPPAATVEARELPAALTVKPPSTGTTESTESPYKAYSPEEGDPLHEEGAFESVRSEPAGVSGEASGPLASGSPATESLETGSLETGAPLEEQTTNHHG